MVYDIKLNNKRYELQISVREIINDGATAVGPLDDSSSAQLLYGIREMLENAVDAIDYAAEQRHYEADCTDNCEDAGSIERSALGWGELAKSLRKLLDIEES